MQESKYGFHCKTGGDGYGHVIHQYAAVGRPLIYRSSQYKNRLAEKFLENDITGFDLDQYTPLEVRDRIRIMSHEDHLRRIGDSLRAGCPR